MREVHPPQEAVKPREPLRGHQPALIALPVPKRATQVHINLDLGEASEVATLEDQYGTKHM